MLSDFISPLGEQESSDGIEDMITSIARLLRDENIPHHPRRQNDAEIALSSWSTLLQHVKRDLSICFTRWESWYLFADVLDSTLETSLNDLARAVPPRWKSGDEALSSVELLRYA